MCVSISTRISNVNMVYIMCSQSCSMLMQVKVLNSMFQVDSCTTFIIPSILPTRVQHPGRKYAYVVVRNNEI